MKELCGQHRETSKRFGQEHDITVELWKEYRQAKDVAKSIKVSMNITKRNKKFIAGLGKGVHRTRAMVSEMKKWIEGGRSKSDVIVA